MAILKSCTLRVQLMDKVPMVRLMLHIIVLFLMVGEFVTQGEANQLIKSCLESDREALLDFKNGLKDDDQNMQLSTWNEMLLLVPRSC